VLSLCAAGAWPEATAIGALTVQGPIAATVPVPIPATATVSVRRLRPRRLRQLGLPERVLSVLSGATALAYDLEADGEVIGIAHNDHVAATCHRQRAAQGSRA
jgi:hypothetical protein